ncbi:copper chaperone PCu(A)C [Thalassotalea sp. M1531]|uniref:Copper chaperone PCu(A)C n=1 Tax=Thalassotalea algicola TaxID=2716224 RepID=A0A7Y0Q5Q7_9GAMM|nr:copper chaperone PCu(A)C [Thalassotalea algicola]NMP30366.1 copper chaperone PCu(A)C [Thalassotalea algicola]
MSTFSRVVTVFTLILSTFSAFGSNVDVNDGYIREVIPGNEITSSYMTINNNSEQQVTLIGAKSREIPRIEIHEHLMADGMMKMRQKEFIIIAAGDSAVLQPMGLHLMMFDIKTPLKAGQDVNVTLLFKEGQEIDVLLPVKSIKQTKPKTKHHHNH